MLHVYNPESVNFQWDSKITLTEAFNFEILFGRIIFAHISLEYIPERISRNEHFIKIM